MTNRFYKKGFQYLWDCIIAGCGAHDFYAVAVDAEEYTPDTETDEDLDDIPVGGRIATAGPFENLSTTLGVLDADDEVFESVTGDEFEYVVVYLQMGSPATTQLLLIFDTATGLPLTPNGGDVTVQWSNGANRICALGT